MQKITHHSATARMRLQPSGIHAASYSGFFSIEAWRHVSRRVMQARWDAGAMIGVDRIYQAVSAAIETCADTCTGPVLLSGVWIVRPDQYEDALRLSGRLADKGITRTVFLQDFEPLALEFAQAHCLAAA